MGWPLAVSAGLMEKSQRALFLTLWPLSVGHLLAILVMLLPFALLLALAQWQREIQAAAALLVIGYGVFLLLRRRHPRALARIPPTQLGLWSFAIAIAHGAGLMLVPIYLGLCGTPAHGHETAGPLVEAFEANAGPWRMAVQCHPERTESTPRAFEALFGAFVEACRVR